MKRLFSCVCFTAILSLGAMANAQAPIVDSSSQTVDDAAPAPNTVLPDLGTIGEEFDASAQETGNVWSRFLENSKQTLTQPFKPATSSFDDPLAAPMLGGNIVQKINEGTKRFVSNTKEALTPKFSTPNLTPPKLTPPKITPPKLPTPKMTTPVFSPAKTGKRLKNVFSAKSSGSPKARKPFFRIVDDAA